MGHYRSLLGLVAVGEGHSAVRGGGLGVGAYGPRIKAFILGLKKRLF
mgnify:CR=1 FL=1